MSLKQNDPKIAELIEKELNRQRQGLEMIASENYTSRDIMEAAGSVLTNKYSEGYPGRRYYGGNEFIDKIEKTAIERACALFGSEAANVQSHSGSSANLSAYLAILNPGDTVLGMQLDHGGHLTHGSKVNFSGKIFNFVPYGVNKETGRIEMELVRKIALSHKPKMILAGATAYPREFDFKAFRDIADEVNAYFMVDMAHIAGLVAAGVHDDPIPHADIVTSTTHKTLRGPRSGIILSKKEDRLKHLYAPKSKASLAQKINKAVFPGSQGGPLDHIVAAKAVCFDRATTHEFRQYQHQVVKNSVTLANTLLENGFELVSGGTDNHLILIDLTNKDITGIQAETALDKALIHTNRNTVPYDPRSPFDPSGLRVGTPALTTRGFKEKEMVLVGQLIAKVIHNTNNERSIREAKEQVLELTSSFPLYPELTYL